MNAIEVRHLTKRYRGRPALDELSLRLETGQIVGLVGDNGSGKTTLLKILAGVLADWTGEVTVLGRVPGPETKALVSFLPDASFLADSSTCERAVNQYRLFFEDFEAERAWEMIRFFKLPEDRSLKEMSKGMREKLQVPLAMSRNARVYLLDEPISGVDPASREVILRGILDGLDPESLLLISTHLIHDVEPVLDSAVFLHEGRVLLQGEADVLREEYGCGLDAIFRKVYNS